MSKINLNYSEYLVDVYEYDLEGKENNVVKTYPYGEAALIYG